MFEIYVDQHLGRDSRLFIVQKYISLSVQSDFEDPSQDTIYDICISVYTLMTLPGLYLQTLVPCYLGVVPSPKQLYTHSPASRINRAVVAFRLVLPSPKDVRIHAQMDRLEDQALARPWMAVST